MGCLFSKKSLSTSAFGDRSSTSTRVQQIQSSTSNGIIRVPKLNLENKDDTQSDTSNDAVSDHVRNHRLRMKPPPRAPSPSPPSPIITPRPEPTAAHSPENERPSFHVQYAEDLEPVTPVKSDMLPSVTDSKNSRSDVTPEDKNSRSRLSLDDKHRSRVSISSVTLKQNKNGIRGVPMPLQDLSVEELDTEMDEFNTFRGSRYPYKKEEKINPVTTDILLPRRKERKEKSVQFDTANKTDDNTAAKDASKPVRKDTPFPSASNTSKHEYKPKCSDVPLEVEEISDNISPNSKQIVHSQNRLENEKRIIAKPNVTKAQDGNVVTFNISTDIQSSVLKNKEIEDSLNKSGATIEKPGTLTDIHVKTEHELYSESHQTIPPKTLYEQELENIRKTRKRKRTRNRQSDYATHPVTGSLNDQENERFLEGSIKSLKARPASGCSTLTLGSTDTLYNFDMETRDDTAEDHYPNINSGTTPVSFRTFVSEEGAEIIDLEDNGDLNDSWLSSYEPVNKEEEFSEWMGVKPYKVFSSTGRKDTGVVKADSSGPSSKEISTKQKLMYSRFARRPQSESVLRTKGMKGKPPLPPGAHLKMRPYSDTVRKTSRYFTTDLDIH